MIKNVSRSPDAANFNARKFVLWREGVKIQTEAVEAMKTVSLAMKETIRSPTFTGNAAPRISLLPWPTLQETRSVFRVSGLSASWKSSTKTSCTYRYLTQDTKAAKKPEITRPEQLETFPSCSAKYPCSLWIHAVARVRLLRGPLFLRAQVRSHSHLEWTNEASDPTWENEHPTQYSRRNGVTHGLVSKRGEPAVDSPPVGTNSRYNFTIGVMVCLVGALSATIDDSRTNRTLGPYQNTRSKQDIDRKGDA